MPFGKRGPGRGETPKAATFAPPVFKDIRAAAASPAQPAPQADFAAVAENLRAGGTISVERPDGRSLTIEGLRAVTLAKPQAQPGFRPDIDMATIMSLAADLFLRLAGAYTDPRGVHLETLMGAMAALTGEFALRAGVEASGHVLPKDAKYVIGGIADPYLHEGDADGSGLDIFKLITHHAIDVGADGRNLPVPLDIVARATIAIGGGLPYPPKPSVPEANMPQEWSPNACVRHRQMVLQLAANHGVFDADEIALALGYAMANLFDRGKEAFGEGRVGVTPNDLLTLATEIMIYTARMAPLDAEIH